MIIETLFWIIQIGEGGNNQDYDDVEKEDDIE